MKYKILKIAFLVWIILWIFLTIRELFIKGDLSDYKVLLSRTLDGKRSYVTGDRLYEFFSFCSQKLPEKASYDLVDYEEGDIEKRRAVYYLYPHLIKYPPDFLLVFDKPNIDTENYDIFARLDETRYILKRRK